MARLRGTGKDPLGRYGEGVLFDVPDTDPLYQDLLDRKWATEVAPEDDPGRTPNQVAEHLVATGGEFPVDPTEREIAQGLKGDEHAIVQTGDPDATSPEPDPSAGSGDRRQVTPDQVNANTRASVDPEGAAKMREKADREAAKGRPSRRRSRAADGGPTKDELLERAAELDIEGRSSMNKEELEAAVSNAEASGTPAE